jgi:hypothetical protein
MYNNRQGKMMDEEEGQRMKGGATCQPQIDRGND